MSCRDSETLHEEDGPIRIKVLEDFSRDGGRDTNIYVLEVMDNFIELWTLPKSYGHFHIIMGTPIEYWTFP